MTSGSRRKRGLSPADRKLWEKVAETAVPLRPAPAEIFENLLPAVARPLPTPAVIRPFQIGERTNGRSGPALKPSVDVSLTGTPVNMDGRSFERLKKGKMPVDGRIDLHGMTLAEAHPALTGFVLNAHMAGKRLLLVITGKGKTFRGEGLMTARRGVLKHQVPQWLQMHPLSPKILKVTQAHSRHGGGGALYVYLRRQR